MKFSNNKLITAFLLFSIIIASGTYVQAHDKSEKQHKKHKSDDRYKDSHHHRHADDDDVIYVIRKPRKVIIQDEDRIYIREYLSRNYSKHCPNGLAKKHHGCTPFGHSKRYVTGYILDEDVVYEELPHDLLIKLRPAPEEYRYVKVDDNVLLISEASKKIIDAVDILSTINR